MSAVGDFLFGDDDEDQPQLPVQNFITAPPEDPSVAKARQQAEARAAVERVTSLQRQLRTETEGREKDIYGSRSLLGNLGTLSTRLGAG
jgi:hypothetical protein